MYAVVDIGGTHTRVAVSANLSDFIHEPESFDTPNNANQGISLISESIKSRTSLSSLKGICVGIAGVRQNNKLVQSPNLGGWIGSNVPAELTMRLHVPVLIENDAALAGLGEVHFGAGSTDRISAYITISTGIGGTRIEYGSLTKRAHSLEPGRQIVDIENERTLEEIASGGALLQEHGMQPKEIDKSIWPELSRYIAVGIYNSILHWSPDELILGGSMTINEPGLYEMIEEHLHDLLDDSYPMPKVHKSKLADTNGLYGGLVLLEQKL